MQTSKPERTKINNQVNDNNLQSIQDILANNLSTEQKEKVQRSREDVLQTLTINNTHNDILPQPEYVDRTFYQPTPLSFEALKIDAAMKGAVASFEEITDLLGIVIKKDEELVNTWKDIIKKYDDFIISLSDVNWKKIIGYSAGLLLISSFLWKMGAMRAIPNFASSLINFIPAPPTLNVTNIAKDTPKPQIDTTLQHIMETPITPFAIVTGMGVLSLGLCALRITAWALRKLPK